MNALSGTSKQMGKLQEENPRLRDFQPDSAQNHP